MAGTQRVAQAAEGFAFDLADALPGQAKFFADFFQGILLAIFQAKAQPQDAGLTRGEGGEDLVQLLG